MCEHFLATENCVICSRGRKTKAQSAVKPLVRRCLSPSGCATGPACANCAEALREWIRGAHKTLARGVELMPLKQLSRWSGVRAVLEECPVQVDDSNS